MNPDFCNFNRVYMKYCDGNSFSGNRDEPLKVTGLDGKPKNLFFRGRRILDAVLQTLLPMGLEQAVNVHLTGCSAGGLATYLHTDYVHSQLKTMAPGLKKFKSSPISGMFLFHDTVEGKSVYQTEMKTIFALANSTHGVNDKCIAAMSAEDAWKCNFAQMAYAHIEAPIFALNSALDAWSTGCIFTSELPSGYPNQTGTANGVCSSAKGWKECSDNPLRCSSKQIVSMNQFITDFNSMMSATSTHSKPGNGAFVHSCHTHCEAQSAAWNKFSINGVTMQQAFSKWWNSDNEPAESHTYAACTYHTSPVAQCSPSCGDSEVKESVQLVI